MVRSPATPFRPQFGLLHRLAGGSEQIVGTGRGGDCIQCADSTHLVSGVGHDALEPGL